VEEAGAEEAASPELFPAGGGAPPEPAPDRPAELSRMRITSLLLAAGSHPAALIPTLADLAARDDRAGPILALAEESARAGRSAKEAKLVELLRAGGGGGHGKVLVFANFSATLDRLAGVLTDAGIAFSLFTGRQTAAEKAQAVASFRGEVPVMLCSEIGGEGHNLQFANTLINFDLPWNPMRIEQRIGRVHRFGQTREVFVFNLCTAGSLEEQILGVLNDKIRMFELVVGEVGSILGNMEEGEEFESLVLRLWLTSQNKTELSAAFDQLGETLVSAQERYLQAKELDDALFGEDYE
jgi:SNF2 family DNA or RNA helicase